jgi:hypothetical protein
LLVTGLLSELNACDRVRSIFSGVWHTQLPDTSKDILQCNNGKLESFPQWQKGQTMFDPAEHADTLAGSFLLGFAIAIG